MAQVTETKSYPQPADLKTRLQAIIDAGNTIVQVIVTHQKPIYIIIYSTP